MSVHQFQKSKSLQKKAHALIPGGCHTYAKGDDQYPILAPSFIERGQGCHVWDVDGNEYIEYGMGNRAVTLGHAYPPVVRAAQEELLRGANFSRPSPLEIRCAEQFLSLVDGAEMVKFCKDGSDATSGAVRLARAYTGRDLIARCADHPFFSVDDWFIGTTEMGAGVPETVKQLTLSFPYNDLASAKALFEQYPGQIAAFILEAARTVEPKPGFRWHNGGAQKVYGIVPDLSCWGKAMSNGYSVSALAGRREFMRLGGFDHYDKPRVFLLSTTHGGETHGLAAALATMQVYQEEPVIEHLYRQGARLKEGAEQSIRRHGLSEFVKITGRPCCLLYATLDQDGKPSQSFRTLFLQETIKRGIIMPSLALSYSHQDADIDRTISAIDGALEIYRRALEDGVERYLIGRASQIVYRRFNQPQEELHPYQQTYR